MATTMLTQTRMMIAYDNYLLAPNMVTTTPITLTGATVASGSSLNNLLYEDPWLTLRTNAPTAVPRLVYQLLSPNPSGRIVGIGLVNQNVLHNYDRFIVEVSSSAGGPWTNFGEADLRNVSPANQYLANMDLLFELNTVTSAQFWRFSFDPNTGAPIEIGNIVGMQLYKVAKNPTVQQFSHDYEREIRQLRAAGGALHVWRGARHVNYSADYIFTRIDDAQATQLHDIFRLYGDRLVGFKAPNQAAYVLPYAMPHFYGRMEGFHVMPEQGATATTHLNTVTTRFTHGW